MSKISITPSATGTGVFTISSPATNTNRTLTLPDETSTLAILGANTFTGAQTFSLFPTISALSYVRLNTANGQGSTNTPIRRFTNIVNNVGTDITYADSATLGGTFTINTDGIYSVSYSDNFNAASWPVGLSLNSNQLTTRISDITIAHVLSMAWVSDGNYPLVASATFFAAAGSVVRAHGEGGATTGTAANGTQFTIARVA